MDGAVPATRTGPVGAYAALILAAAGVYYLHAARPQTDQSMAVASLLVSALCLTAVTRVWGRSLLQGPVLYLSLFLIFHLGIAWTLGFGGYEAVRQISPTAFQWIRSGYLPAAVTLACGGALVFSAVCTLLPPKQSGGQIPREAAKGPPDVPPDQRQLARSLGATGVALELVGLGLVLSSVISAGGVELLFGGYLQFLESAQPGDLAYGIWAIGVGASLSQLGTRGARRTGVTVFLLFSLVMFPLGLRGSVLFPAAVLLATRAALGERLRAAYLGVGVLAVLTLSAVVRTTRIGGAGSAGEWYRAPISTITELGFSAACRRGAPMAGHGAPPQLVHQLRGGARSPGGAGDRLARRPTDHRQPAVQREGPRTCRADRRLPGRGRLRRGRSPGSRSHHGHDRHRDLPHQPPLHAKRHPHGDVPCRHAAASHRRAEQLRPCARADHRRRGAPAADPKALSAA